MYKLIAYSFYSISDLKKKSHRVWWQDTQHINGPRLDYDGMPFMVLGKKTLECHNGPDRNKAQKAKRKKSKQVNIIWEDINTVLN